MKFHFILIVFSLCGSAWAAEQVQPAPATSNTATPVAEQSAPATTTDGAVPAAKKTEAASEQAGFSRGSVVRSIFTTGIQEREPVDKLKDTAGKTDKLFYYTELRDMSGQTATHRWEYQGKVISEVKFDVRGPRWRVWSSKAYSPGWEGDWKVSVLNGAGEIISEDMIKFTQPAPESKAISETPAADAPATGVPAEKPFEPPVNPEMIN